MTRVGERVHVIVLGSKHDTWSVRLLAPLYKPRASKLVSLSLVLGHVLSPVRFLPRHSFFADCKLYIRTRLLASASSNFWKLLPFDCVLVTVPLRVLEERLLD